MSEVPTATQPPLTTLRIEGPRHKMGLKGKLACVLTAAAVTVGAVFNTVDGIDLPRFSMPNWGDIFGGEAEPGQGETEQTTRESFQTQAEFDAECKATISAGTGVKGKQDYVVDAKLFSWTTGTAKVNKRIYGDADLCGESGSVVANAVVEGEKVTKDGQTTTSFTRVTATTDGLKPHRARVNHQMWQNCVPERFGDSVEAVRQKQDRWLNDKSAHCDTGFDVSGTAGDAVVELKDMANTAAQTGLAISEIPSEVLDRHNVRLKADLEARLRQIYPGAEVTVNVVPRPTENLQARIDAEAENLRRNHYGVTVRQEFNPETKKTETILHLVGRSGTEMDVRAGSASAGDFSISDLRQRSEQTMSPPSTAATTRKAA